MCNFGRVELSSKIIIKLIWNKKCMLGLFLTEEMKTAPKLVQSFGETAFRLSIQS